MPNIMKALQIIFFSGVLFLADPCLAKGLKPIALDKVASLNGDFVGLQDWKVGGEYQVIDDEGRKVVAVEKDLALSFEQELPSAYSVRAWVKFGSAQRAKGRIALTCAGVHELELQHTKSRIYIKALTNGLNLWGDATYRYREGRAPRTLTYHLKLDPKRLAKKLEGMKKTLAGRTEEWDTWGLGIRGDFMEERQVKGIEALMQENEAQPLAEERWTRLGMDVGADAVRMWVDGRMVGEVRDPPLPAGGVSLSLPAKSQLRELEILGAPAGAGEFLPLDLAGYCNRQLEGLALSTGELVRVKDIPFSLNGPPSGANCIDVGRSAPMETGFGKGFMHSPFDSANALLRHPSRCVLLVPKGWYSHLYVLAFSEEEPDTEPVVSFRFFRSERTGTIIDYRCEVPSREEKAKGKVVSSVEVTGTGGAKSWLHVVEVTLEPGLMQSYLEKSYFRAFRIEITKGLHFTRGYPDPWNYISVPAGKKSSVRILGLTFKRLPLEMVVTTDEVGHVIAQPEKPYLNLLFRNRSSRSRRVSLEVSAEGADGGRSELQSELAVPEACSLSKRYLLPLERYGFYRVRVQARSGPHQLVKETTLGYLPPDTRRAGWGDSSFGIWGWGAGVGGYSYPIDSEETMRLIWKLGGRWTLNPPDPQIARKYGITNAWSFLMRKFDFAKTPKEKWEPELRKAMREGLKKNREKFRDQDLFLVFGEANLGVQQTYALPGPCYGEPHYQLNEKEQQKFERFFERAALYGKVLKGLKEEFAEFRNVKLTFGNTSPNFHIEFLRKGFPKEYIDVFGIDIPYFERMPERPPRSVEGSQLVYLYEARKELGCEQIPICGTEDMYFPGCPGSLTQREQADYFVRSHLLKFALGVTRESSVGMVFSTSGPYGRGHYGATGLFEVSPEGGGDGNPRESAVAYATMTRVLDAAKYETWFPTGSLSTFCLAFSRKFTKDEVLALWTIHGQRAVSILLDADLTAQVTDQWGNTADVRTKGKALRVEVTSSPVYVTGVKRAQVREVKAGSPTYSSRPSPGYALLEDFEAPWQSLEGRDTDYEENCFDLPKFKGKMTSSLVERAGGGKAFQVALQKPAKERRLAPWYTAFVPPAPVPLPGKPTKLGVYVKGNSGWGRIIPQVTDAKGEVWTFIGPKDAWNADDIRSQSSVNFDGWKYMEMELPNTLPNQWPGPALAFWKNEKGDRVVDYPLALTKLFIEQYTHVVYVNEILPVPETVLTFDTILCTYDDPYEQWHLMKGW